MTRKWRLLLFWMGAAGIALLFAAGMQPLRRLSDIRNRYAAEINSRSFAERNATDAVTAVNFDYRGFDTVGEEFILFVSVLGALVLLRMAEEREENPIVDALDSWRDVPPSEATRLWILMMLAPKLAFGIYIVTHGQLTPGGGFQGGVVLASAALIIYVAEQFAVFRAMVNHTVLEMAEALGAGGFVMIGMLAWFWKEPFLTNILPLGKSHELTSAGTIPLISIATGLEVAAGFILLLHAFLQETLLPSSERD